MGLTPTLLLAFVSVFIAFFAGFTPAIVLFMVLFVPLGFLIGRIFPEQGWKSGIWPSIGYSIWLVFILYSIFSFNYRYPDFVRTEFFPSAALLYLSPAAVALASSNFGSRLSKRSLSYLLLVFAVIAATFAYIASIDTFKTESVSIPSTLAESSDLHVTAEIKCGKTRSKNYMHFFNSDNLYCGETKIFVSRKPSHIILPATLSVVIDGVEEEVAIWPLNAVGGDAIPVNPRKPETYGNAVTWQANFPWHKVARNKRVELKWGQIEFEIGKAELERVRDRLDELRD